MTDRVALDDREQRPDRRGRRLGGRGLVGDRRGRCVGGSGLGHPLEDVSLVCHEIANGSHEIGKLVMTLLEDHVDVGPRLSIR